MSDRDRLITQRKVLSNLRQVCERIDDAIAREEVILSGIAAELATFDENKRIEVQAVIDAIKSGADSPKPSKNSAAEGRLSLDARRREHDDIINALR